MHDLLRIYARELAGSEDPHSERRDAIHQLLLWYLHSAAAAESHLNATPRRVELETFCGTQPPLTFVNSTDAMAWLETERPNLVAASRQAYDEGLLSIAWQLPATLGVYFYIRKYWTDWLTTHETALAAAESQQRHDGIARVATSLGSAHYDQQNFANAIKYHQQALRVRRDIEDLVS
jgi:hypothetical protein